jgi:MoxR-like ATPase
MTAPLLEREEPLELMEQLLVQARDGRGVLVLFEGAPGIGKSRLLGAACEAAETLGVQVLRARGGELERGSTVSSG